MRCRNFPTSRLKKIELYSESEVSDFGISNVIVLIVLGVRSLRDIVPVGEAPRLGRLRIQRIAKKLFFS
jgi:hypothetical protein